MTSLPSIRPGLLRHQLLDQVLVYDTDNDKLHLLDRTTATVVELLEKGHNSEAIAAKLEQQQGTHGGSELLDLALDELAKADLTENGAKVSVRIPEVTRRQMLQSFASIGAAVLIPAIVTLTPARAYALTSSQCDFPCTATSQCTGQPCSCCKATGIDKNTCRISSSCIPG